MLNPLQLPHLWPHPRDPPLEGPQQQWPHRLHQRKPLLRCLHGGETPGNRCNRHAVHNKIEKAQGDPIPNQNMSLY
ncbi:unnamed protein product [Prunus armeniaca]